MLMPEMETERLIIRSTREADGPDCLSLWLDEEVGRYLADPPREKASEKYLNFAVGIENSTSWYPMVMIHKESGEFLGTCSVVPREDGACLDFGYCIRQKYWRQGYGTETLRRLIRQGVENGVRSFTADVAVENAGSNALLQKLGFRIWKSGSTFQKSGTDIIYPEYTYRLDLPQTNSL